MSYPKFAHAVCPKCKGALTKLTMRGQAVDNLAACGECKKFYKIQVEEIK